MFILVVIGLHMEAAVTDIFLGVLYCFEAIAKQVVAHSTHAANDNAIVLLYLRVETDFAVVI